MELFGFPYHEVRLGADDVAGADRQRRAVAQFAAASGGTDLLVLVHGWAETADDARRRYRALAACCADGLGRVPALAGRRLALLGVLWPAGAVPAGLRPASRLAGDRSALPYRLARLGRLVGDPSLTGALAPALAALARLDRPAARRDFADAVRAALGGVRLRLGGSEELPRAFFTADGAELFDRLAHPAQLLPRRHLLDIAAPPPGRGAGPILLGGCRHGAGNLVDFAEYLLGQDRASTVGQHGLAPLLGGILAGRADLRLHLVGHGPGACVVSAAASRPGLASSLVLLQGAQSAVGFAAEWRPGGAGSFRGCLTGGVAGPIVATHTANDAVELAYLVAHCLGGDPAGRFPGPPGGRWRGGLAQHGARRTAEAVDGDLLARTASYAFRPGRLYNLRADAYIPHHDAIACPEVTNALLAAVSWTA